METIGTINQELDTKKIQMTEHAYKRAAERFGIKNKVEALGQFRGKLRQAVRIGDTIDENGEPSILYAHGRTAIHLTPDLQRIKTVYRQEYVTYDPIKQRVQEIHAKEIRKLDRSIRAKQKKILLMKAKAGIEVAELNYRILTTRSSSVKTSAQNRIVEINQDINNLENEIRSMQETKRQIGRSMIAVL